MFKQFLKALKILSDGDRINFYIINLFLILSVALEFLTFTLIVPIISIIFGKNDNNQNSLLDNFKFLDQENLNMILIFFLIVIALKLSTLYFFKKKFIKLFIKFKLILIRIYILIYFIKVGIK